MNPMHKALHPKDDIDRLYALREGLASIEDSVDALIRQLEDSIKIARKALLQRPETRINRTAITGKQKLKELYGYFKRQTNEILHEKTWAWQRKRDL